MGEYIPSAPINDEAKKNNKNLPGMGGVFNPINFHLYHYAGNSPIRYVDPDGRENFDQFVKSKMENYFSNLEDGAKYFFNSLFRTNEIKNYEIEKQSLEITFDFKPFLENCCNGFTVGSYLTKNIPIEGIYATSKIAVYTKGLNNIGTLFTFTNLYFDEKKAYSSLMKAMYPTNSYDAIFGKWNATFDCLTVGCDIFGAKNPTTAMISVPIDYSLQLIKYTSEQLGEYKLYKESIIINNISKSIIGTNIK